MAEPIRPEVNRWTSKIIELQKQMIDILNINEYI